MYIDNTVTSNLRLSQCPLFGGLTVYVGFKQFWYFDANCQSDFQLLKHNAQLLIPLLWHLNLNTEIPLKNLLLSNITSMDTSMWGLLRLGQTRGMLNIA